MFHIQRQAASPPLITEEREIHKQLLEHLAPLYLDLLGDDERNMANSEPMDAST